MKPCITKNATLNSKYNSLKPITAYHKPLPGFSLVELLITITIIAIITIFGLVQYRSASKHARNNARETDRQTLETALESYYADNRQYPSNLTQLKGKYLDIVPEDPLGTSPYVYQYSHITSGCPASTRCDYTLTIQLE